MGEFWAITTFFNPAKYKSLLNNYFLFAEQLKRQGVPLLTVECAFNGDEFEIPEGPNVHRVRSDSIMWQKERLINHGVSLLPSECKYYSWLDCDIVFSADDWAVQAVQKLQNADIIQVYKKVIYLPKGKVAFDGEKLLSVQSVIWQKMIHRDWLARRKRKELPFSAPGFGWACRREAFEDMGGMYDKNIIGSGDTFLVDCLLDSWDIHGFSRKFTPAMKVHMMDWASRLKAKNLKLDYLPIDIYHLWHGSLKNRKYMDRHDVILKHEFDPVADIEQRGATYEWATPKAEMHDDIRSYFHARQEDDV